MYKHWPSRKDRVSSVADLVHRITGLRYIREFFLCNFKELLYVLKSLAVSVRAATIFNYYVIQNTPSDAESCEEQDDSKHKFVGGMTAKLWPDFHKGVVINTEEK